MRVRVLYWLSRLLRVSVGDLAYYEGRRLSPARLVVRRVYRGTSATAGLPSTATTGAGQPGFLSLKTDSAGGET